MTPFKTYSGAAKRAQAERFYNPDKRYTYRVVENTNATQRAQGFLFRVKKEKAK